MLGVRRASIKPDEWHNAAREPTPANQFAEPLAFPKSYSPPRTGRTGFVLEFETQAAGLLLAGPLVPLTVFQREGLRHPAARSQL